MPKKFKSENTKAVAARERKAAARNAEQERIDKEKEDAYWRDDDKHSGRKQQRKTDKEQKRADQLQRKQELAAMYAAEVEAAGGSKKGKAAAPKVTRAEITAQREARLVEERKAAETDVGAVARTTAGEEDLEPIPENLNRLEVEGAEARTVEDAITVLSVKDEAAGDLHPEKRMKAAYTAFEAQRLPELKQLYPTYRLSQLKQTLRKEWNKHPDNPLIKALKD